MLEVKVRKNNVEHALRILKRKIKDSGLMLELREREFYTKPSVKNREKRKSGEVTAINNEHLHVTFNRLKGQ